MIDVTHNTPDRDRDVAAMRQPYDPPDRDSLLEADLPAHWLPLFERWLDAAIAAGFPEPNAMIVASADTEGRPSARTVLLKGLDATGFTFYTNYNSRKGTELAANPAASLVFPWFPMHRQVVVCGSAERVDRATTEAYFAARPRESQLGAWASPQSQPVSSRTELDAALDMVRERFADMKSIPAPPYWGGLRVRPETVEFWHGRTSRLHDRLRYTRSGDEWTVERLGP
jgi:pyridoxamine 5'-phosphate oxidase